MLELRPFPLQADRNTNTVACREDALSVQTSHNRQTCDKSIIISIIKESKLD